jgi:hypothetical protein
MCPGDTVLRRCLDGLRGPSVATAASVVVVNAFAVPRQRSAHGTPEAVRGQIDSRVQVPVGHFFDQGPAGRAELRLEVADVQPLSGHAFRVRDADAHVIEAVGEPRNAEVQPAPDGFAHRI